MIKDLKGILVGLALLALSACGGAAPVGEAQTTDLSPREQAQQVMDTYVVLLSAAVGAQDTASTTGLSDAIVIKIGAVSHAATDAERAYVEEAKKCWRDEKTGLVGDTAGLPEGQHCNPSTVGRLLSVFTMKTGALGGTLDAFGIKHK